MARRKKTLSERFWDKVEVRDGCWGWTASKEPFGYGQMLTEEGKERAHRISYVLHFGGIPEGLCVLHKCDTPECTNPEHLFLGTRSDNNVDRAQKGRTSRVSRNAGVSQWRSTLTDSDVVQIRERRNRGISLKELAEAFNTSVSNISSISRGVTWRHVGE